MPTPKKSREDLARERAEAARAAMAKKDAERAAKKLAASQFDAIPSDQSAASEPYHSPKVQESIDDSIMESAVFPDEQKGTWVRQVDLHPTDISLDSIAQRSEDEYSGKDYEDLLTSIKEHGRNLLPIAVAEVMVNGIAHYHLIYGSRRLRACKELGLMVRADVLKCSANMLDKLHDVENTKRASKSPYSFALQIKKMRDSGRYGSDQRSIALALGFSPGHISDALSLIDDAPQGLWSVIKDPSSITFGQARTLIKAYKKPEFISYVKALSPGSTPAKTLMGRVALILKKADQRPLHERVVLKTRGDKSVIELPADFPERLRMQLLDHAKQLARSSGSG